MTEIRWAFWGYSVQELALAAGQFMLMVSAFMLAAKNIVWFWRGRHQRERRHWRTARAWVELVVSAFIAVLYARQIYSDGATSRLDGVEAVLQAWAFAILLAALVAARRDDMPHAPRK